MLFDIPQLQLGLLLLVVSLFVLFLRAKRRLLPAVFSIKRVGWLSVNGVTFADKGIAFSTSSVVLRLHIPNFSTPNPRWASVRLYNVEYVDQECHVNLSQVKIDLWFFPVLFRATGGPWVSVTLEDFILKVFSSKVTPEWVEHLRRNLVSTVLLIGTESLRLDDLKTTVDFGVVSAPSPVPAYLHQKESSEPRPVVEEGDAEIRITVEAQMWMLRNVKSRLYTFGNVRMQHRRTWEIGVGTLSMIAKECSWVKVPKIQERISAFPHPSKLRNMMLAIFNFPSDVIKIIRDPLCTVDIYVPRLDVTFDQFRLQDAELLRQGAELVRQQWQRSNREGAFRLAAWDAFSQATLSLLGM